MITSTPPPSVSTGLKTDSHFIDGVWHLADDRNGRIEVVNPTTTDVIATVPLGTPADVELAVAAARKASSPWAALSHGVRADLLEAIADLIDADADRISDIIVAELGCPVGFARARQVAGASFHFRAAADLARAGIPDERIGNSLVVREPYGVVGAITPWNYPLIQIAAKVAYAMAAGNTVVLKPSEVTPLCVYVLAEAAEKAGLPAGVLNIVMGDGPGAGEALCRHPGVDVLSFTGSTNVGRRIAEIGAATVKHVMLELGGKSPTVVAPGGDLETAAGRALINLARNSGQTCAAQTRLIVPRSDLAEAERLVAASVETIRVGDPRDPATDMGPVVSRAQFDRVRQHILDGIESGATLVCGGLDRPEGLDEGYFVAPTAFSNVTRGMSVETQEIFGPVLVIIPYDDLDEAIAIANGTDYGLSAGVWAEDEATGVAIARRIESGQVQVNGGAFNDLAPFGGYKQSGNGREFGEHGFDDFLQIKSMQL